MQKLKGRNQLTPEQLDGRTEYPNVQIAQQRGWSLTDMADWFGMNRTSVQHMMRSPEPRYRCMVKGLPKKKWAGPLPELEAGLIPRNRLKGGVS